jgi:CHASE2 domain-containing sensor protein
MSEMRVQSDAARRRRAREAMIRGVLVSALLGLFSLHAAGIARIGPLVQLEQLAYDLRVRLTLAFEQDDRIVIVRLDEQSFAREGRWPWPAISLAERPLLSSLFPSFGSIKPPSVFWCMPR